MQWRLLRRWTGAGPQAYPLLDCPLAHQAEGEPIEAAGARHIVLVGTSQDEGLRLDKARELGFQTVLNAILLLLAARLLWSAVEGVTAG